VRLDTALSFVVMFITHIPRKHLTLEFLMSSALTGNQVMMLCNFNVYIVLVGVERKVGMETVTGIQKALL
jgi:hypothetical protein